MNQLFCFGLGYSAAALARRVTARDGWTISGTSTDAEKAKALTRKGYNAFLFDGRSRNAEVAEALRSATHVLLSIPPDATGDPAFTHYRDDIASARQFRGSAISLASAFMATPTAPGSMKSSPPNPRTERGLRRLNAEKAWLGLGRQTGKAVVIFRLPGIYGPGRSAIDQLRAGTARRVFKPGQVTNRIHVDDIAAAVDASLNIRTGDHVFNVTDDLPAAPQDVIAYGAELLGLPCPPATDPADAGLTPMARSFYAESKKVSNARMKAELGVSLAYPTYVEGLKAIAERTE